MTENKRAVGVEFLRNNRKEKVKASREVIVSSGSIGSPQILMLSGIGPKKQLEKLGVSFQPPRFLFINHHEKKLGVLPNFGRMFVYMWICM